VYDSYTTTSNNFIAVTKLCKSKWAFEGNAQLCTWVKLSHTVTTSLTLSI